MADTRKIVIEINNVETTKDNVQTDAPKQSGNGTAKDNNEGKKVLGKSVILNQAFNQAKSMVINSTKRNFNRYFTLSEDYLAENTYNLVETYIGKAVGLGTAVIGGAMVGGFAGAVIGTVGWGFNEAISYRDRMSSFYQTLNASKYQSEFMSKRAGLTDGSKGTEN